MDVLQELLGLAPMREFLQRHFARVPLPCSIGRYKHHFTEADFAAMVKHSRTIVRVVHNGRLVQDNARLSWAEAQAYHRRGHSRRRSKQRGQVMIVALNG